MANKYSKKTNELFNNTDEEIYEDHFLYGLRKVPTGHVRVYGPSEREMKMQMEVISRRKADNTIESILGAAALGIVVGGALIDKYLLNGNGALGFAGGIICAGALGNIYYNIKYKKVKF